MNYYNPYYQINPYQMSGLGLNRTGLGTLGRLGSLGKKLNFSSILNGTGRTLNFINQALPLVKQATPMINNAKTMFRVMNEFKKIDTPSQNKAKPVVSNNTNRKEPEKKEAITDNAPTFFL